jgi:hypothetical protein
VSQHRYRPLALVRVVGAVPTGVSLRWGSEAARPRDGRGLPFLPPRPYHTGAVWERR